MEAGETYIIAWIDYYSPGPFSWTLEAVPYETYQTLSDVGGIEKVNLDWSPVPGSNSLMVQSSQATYVELEDRSSDQRQIV